MRLCAWENDVVVLCICIVGVCWFFNIIKYHGKLS
jgi:hypothetical protein